MTSEQGTEAELRGRAEFAEVLAAARAYTGNSDGPVEPWRIRGELADQLRINTAQNTPQLRAGWTSFSSQVLDALNKLAGEGFLVKAAKNQPGPGGARKATARFYRPATWDRLKTQAEQAHAEHEATRARWKAVAEQLKQLGLTPGDAFRPQLKLDDWERLLAMTGPDTGAGLTEGAGPDDGCGCGERITWYDGEWMHIANPQLRGTDDHPAEPMVGYYMPDGADAEDAVRCECGLSFCSERAMREHLVKTLNHAVGMP